MEPVCIQLPENHTLEKILEFGNSLYLLPVADEYVIDFQGPKYVTPFGMVFLSQFILNFKKTHPDAAFRCQNATNGYAGYMGFFRACGFEVGKIPHAFAGTDRYLPITVLSIQDLVDEASRTYDEIGSVIERRSKELARILAHQEGGLLLNALTYSMREMIRNVAEHSESETVTLCAQYRPKIQQAEIAILDSGIGIRSSLSKNPHLTINDDHTALILALTPGVSGKTYKGVPQNPNDVWQNSGFGLYMVSQLCGYGGKFFIGSGKSGISWSSTEKENYEVIYPGTALRLILCSKDIKNLQQVLSVISKNGSRLAKEFAGNDFIEASLASQMLYEDIQRLVENQKHS